MSPWTRNSYTSSSLISLPSRRSPIVRIEPLGPGPPAAATADRIVDWLAMVYVPGRCAGPTTNTFKPRSRPSVTLRLKFVYTRPIWARRWRSMSAALMPATLKLPTLGRLI